jgi:hypothetical protein
VLPIGSGASLAGIDMSIAARMIIIGMVGRQQHKQYDQDDHPHADYDDRRRQSADDAASRSGGVPRGTRRIFTPDTRLLATFP